jgi:hypothetical protein
MFRRLTEQDYYQVLEIPYDASCDDIQTAYEEAREIYSHDALVSGSILSPSERRRVAERIAEAYQTLIAEESRRIYDEEIGIRRRLRMVSDASLETREVPPAGVAPAEGLEGSKPAVVAETAPRSVKGEPSEPRVCPLQLRPAEEATGEFLRRAREIMDIDLATISRETKIGCSMLEYIENERLDRLPAPIYLRNFTRQLARYLGLDEERVSRTYLARIERLEAND